MMVWATAGQQFNLESMLVATVARCTPIALGALSGILCERSGVVNIGIEGMLLGGAFTGVVMGSLLGGVGRPDRRHPHGRLWRCSWPSSPSISESTRSSSAS